MGSAFNEQEREIIIAKLKEAANVQARTVGMRKTSVEELAKKANISKGAFYNFYPTKEHLFFDILEDWHEGMVQAALDTVRKNMDAPVAKRIELAFFSLIKCYEEDNVISFIENDIEIIIRKIPREMMEKHSNEDARLIELVLAEANAKANVPVEIVAGLLHTFIYTMSHRQDLGDQYSMILKVLVESICKNVFEDLSVQ